MTSKLYLYLRRGGAPFALARVKHKKLSSLSNLRRSSESSRSSTVGVALRSTQTKLIRKTGTSHGGRDVVAGSDLFGVDSLSFLLSMGLSGLWSKANSLATAASGRRVYFFGIPVSILPYASARCASPAFVESCKERIHDVIPDILFS